MPVIVIQLPSHSPLREGLVIHARNDSDKHVVLEDSRNAEYFRIGESERDFVEALLESGSAHDAYRHYQEHRPKSHFSMVRAERFCKWLLVNDLIALDVAPNPKPKKTATRNPLVALFFWKIPLVDPDRCLMALNQSCGWMFCPRALLVAPLGLLLGVLATGGQWSQFFASCEKLFSSWRWIWIAIAWTGLKIIHETAHGVTCRRYGGEVKEAGLAMILLMPIAYVNVTSSWRFASRWQRLHVTIAGVMIELLLAGLALLAWNQFDSLPLKQAAADVVLMASVSSILFNLNPLLKFDGYFALADVTGIDNLYDDGQSYARYFGGRYFLGLNSHPPKLPGKFSGLIKWYGCSAAFYRVFTVAGLLTAAATIFHGAGILIAAAGVVSFVFKPMTALVRHLRQLRRSGDLSLTRLTLRTGLLSALAICPFWLIPASGSWTSPGIVQYSPPAVLRVRSSGFVENVHVTDGQWVQAGSPIVTLRNENLNIKLLRQKKQLAQINQEILSAQWRGMSIELAGAVTRKDGLQQQLDELQLDVDQLVLRAPIDGRIISRRLSILAGTFVQSGDEVAVIGREDSKRIKVSIGQVEARETKRWQGKTLRIVVSNRSTFTGKLSRIETRADTAPPDDALLAINGGALAAIQERDDRFVLSEPRVNGIIELTSEQSKKLRCGQRASVYLGNNNGSLGYYYLTRLWYALPHPPRL